MKTGNVKGMSFGFASVNAGQRNMHVEPQVIAVSTEGGFRITPPVSRILGVGNGEYVMFISNVANIDAAIAAKDEQLVAFCDEAGLELGTSEAAIAIHREFDLWAVAKGIAEYDAKGNVKTAQERLTKKDKMKFVNANFDAMLESAQESADDEIKDALFRDGITKEEQMDILTSFVVPREVAKFKGSKVANPAGLTGAGTSLTFTDSNVWKQLKADMGDTADKFNRCYDVDVDNLQDIEINDGYKTVVVKALILGDYTDQEPARVGKGADDTEA